MWFYEFLDVTNTQFFKYFQEMKIEFHVIKLLKMELIS
jgi:hypothetical protein